jgi:ribosome-binding factor A
MSKRPKMLASVVREVVAPVLQNCPSKCGMLSITEVVVSDDFSYATIYISALQEPEHALQFLDKRTKEIKTKMGAIYRKKIPEIRFRIDDRVDTGGRMDNLLREAEEGGDN